MAKLCRSVCGDTHLEMPASGMRANHGAGPRPRHFGDLAVRQAMDVAEHESLSERRRQSRDRCLKHPRLSLGNQYRLGRLDIHIA